MMKTLYILFDSKYYYLVPFAVLKEKLSSSVTAAILSLHQSTQHIPFSKKINQEFGWEASSKKILIFPYVRTRQCFT